MAQSIMFAATDLDIADFHKKTASFGQAGLEFRVDILKYCAAFPQAILELSGEPSDKKNALKLHVVHLGQPVEFTRTPRENELFRLMQLEQSLM